MGIQKKRERHWYTEREIEAQTDRKKEGKMRMQRVHARLSGSIGKDMSISVSGSFRGYGSLWSPSASSSNKNDEK